MPISMAAPGVEQSIKKINGKDETRRFLETLGFTVGSNVIVVNELGGNLIISVKGSRVALNKGMACRIIV